MAVISMKQLLEAGVHFGHQTRRWNPKMKKYIFTERNGIYIIDLQKTVKLVDAAYDYMKNVAEEGGVALFVGTKKQAQECVKEAAEKLKSYLFDALVVEQFIDGNSAVDFCMSVKGRYTGMLRLIMADQVDRELAEAKERNIIDNYMIKPVSDLDILNEMR